jgi:hypothetical protein
LPLVDDSDCKKRKPVKASNILIRLLLVSLLLINHPYTFEVYRFF